MIGTDFVILSALLFPKLIKPKKRRKKLSRHKARFRVKDHPFKTYHEKTTPQERIDFALKCRAERLNNPTNAELALAALLAELGCNNYEREHIWHYGGGFAIFDFFFKEACVIVEVDGGYHNDPAQHRHDVRRDAYFDSIGYRTIRLTNETVRTNPEHCKAVIRRAGVR